MVKVKTQEKVAPHDTYTLPDGEKVLVSRTPEDWWTMHKISGYVYLDLLAPNPNQPRRAMDDLELEELTGSIAAIGVEDSLVITPIQCVPWVTVEDEYKEKAFFSIVSGHRRHRAATAANVLAVPVEVRIYDSPERHSRDMIIFNKGRSNLTPLEEGFEFQAYLNLPGMTVAKVAKENGTNVQFVYRRLALTKLSPKIQKLIHPSLPQKKKLPGDVASDLGSIPVLPVSELKRFATVKFPEPEAGFDALSDEEKRFFVQLALLDKIQTENLGAVRARNLIKTTIADTNPTSGIGSKMKHRVNSAPRKQFEILQGLVRAPRNSVVVDWEPSEFGRVLSTRKLSELREILGQYRETMQLFQAIAYQMAQTIAIKTQKNPREILEALGLPTLSNQEPLSMATKNETAEEEFVTPTDDGEELLLDPDDEEDDEEDDVAPLTDVFDSDNINTPSYTPELPRKGNGSVPFLARPKSELNGSKSGRKGAPRTTTKGFMPITVCIFDPQIQQMVLGKVERPDDYITKFHAGVFDWQIDNRPQPKNFPPIEEVEALLKPRG